MKRYRFRADLSFDSDGDARGALVEIEHFLFQIRGQIRPSLEYTGSWNMHLVDRSKIVSPEGPSAPSRTNQAPPPASGTDPSTPSMPPESVQTDATASETAQEQGERDPSHRTGPAS